MGKNIKLRNMTSVYLLRGTQILLLYREGSMVANHQWVGSAGGHFEESELNDARACVLRELKEELSITEEYLVGLQLKYVTLRRAKGEIRQNYYFFANLEREDENELVSNEGILRWFELEELQALEMPFSAKYMIEHYVTIGRYDDMLYVGTADGEKVVFAKLPEF